MPKKPVKVQWVNGGVYINGFAARLVNKITDEESLLGIYGRYIWEDYTKTYLVKFDDLYWKQSTREIEVWKSLEKADRSYFSKVVAWGQVKKVKWIAVEKEKIKHTSYPPPEARIKLRYLIEKYGIGDIANYWDSDGEKLIPNNFALRTDGSLIIYDFGMKMRK